MRSNVRVVGLGYLVLRTGYLRKGNQGTSIIMLKSKG